MGASSIFARVTGRGQAIAPTMATKHGAEPLVHSRGDGLSSPIYTNLRKDEFVPAGNDRRCRNTKCPRLVGKRLVGVYEKRGVSPVVQADARSTCGARPCLYSRAQPSLTQHRCRLWTARPPTALDLASDLL